MSCMEKRHMSHRMGSMLHHRFPNGFNDLFMDETDREVCTLTDRAFRSLCVGDDAVYNDEFLYGYSPFSCHKPLAGEPLKKAKHKESKKQGKTKNDKNYAQHQKRISHMSSFLKALSATEESCEGMLIKNGGIIDSKEESWDKSALRSIQRELSEFSSDYHTSFKDVGLPSGKSAKTKKVKSTVKLRKLNIKNFFFHSEFSPFQVWRDFNRSFGLGCTVLPMDNVPKWYDMPFYKELTERHREDMLREEEEQLCEKVTVEPLPPTAPKSIPPSPPPKVLPKPTTTPVEKKFSSDGGDESSAPWRRNRSRTKSVIPGNQAGIPLQENRSKPVDESLPLIKKEIHSVEVKAAEEVNSLASTPFSICQLMTPLIPSRQPTETSEILQGILSPSILDPLRPHSDAKLTPEPPVKRDSYKSLASSILFNLKDNRKRVKSHYSSPKFRSSEVAGGDNQSLETYGLKHPETTSDGDASGLSTPATSKDGQRVCSPILESNSTLTDELPKQHTEKPISDDYLLSHLLQSNRAAPGNGGPDEENSISPFIQSNTKNHIAKKQNYPSLNLYKKSDLIESDMKYLQVPLSSVAPIHKDQPTDSNGPKTLILNKEISPKAQPKTTVSSPNTINVSSKDYSPVTAPSAFMKEGLSAYLPSSEIRPNVRDKAKQPAKDSQEKKCSGLQRINSSENDTNGQPVRTKDVIKAAREAINAAKSKALSAIQSDSTKKPIPDMEELREKEKDRKVAYSKEVLSSKRESSVPEKSNISCHGINEATFVGKKGKKEPQPVPKRDLAKSDIQAPADKHQEHNDDKLIKGDLIDTKLDLPNDNKSVQKPVKLKHVFSARQNNYIKSQRYSMVDVEHREEFEEGDQKVNTGMEMDDKRMILREIRDSGHIINDLQALKELERAKLGDHVLINARKKISLVNIEEEARTKNDLISKELKNIKKGMMSMRGNTLAKRDLFASKGREQNKKDVFTKRDSNAIVNKALFNDNYDKAKMALEEIISDRQKRKNKTTEPDVKPISDGNASDESYVAGLQKDYTTENNEQHDSNIRLKEDLNERLDDLKDHNHMRQILRQTEPGLSETSALGARMVVSDELADNPSYESEENVLRRTERWICDDRSKNVIKQNEDNRGEPPPVPPRSKKPESRRDVCVTEEVDSLKNVARDDIFVQTNGKKEQRLKELMSTSSEKHEVDAELSRKESVHSDNDTDCNKVKWELENTSNPNIHKAADSLIDETTLPSTCSQSKNRLHLEEVRLHDNEASRADMSFTTEETLKNINDEAQETYKLKQNVALNLDPLNILDDSATKNLAAEDSNRNNKPAEEIHMDAEADSEIPRDVISPLLLINGLNISQSPPDQSSLSSKSSYFSAESALHRTLETGSNVYNSLENLTGEVEGVDEATHNISQKKKDKAEVDYCAPTNHEIEAEVEKMQTESQEKEALCEDSKGRENMTTIQGVIPASSSNTFSQPLGIPSLFRVKDNTSINKKKAAHPWSPRGSLSGSERGEDELHQIKEISDFSLTNEPVTTRSTPIPEETFESKEIPPTGSPPQVQTPSKAQSENRKTPEFGEFLTVPQQDDRFSGVSPSSEGVESLTTSTADTGDDLGLNAGGHLVPEVSKVPSERSGSTCSGNESQAGLPKPPAVLPKSEKAVLKAIKLTKRRIKKEVQASSQSSSRHRAEGHKSDKPEHTSSTSRNNKNSEKNGEKCQRHKENYDRNGDGQNEKLRCERRSHNSETRRSTRTDTRQSTDSVESVHQNRDSLAKGTTEREGRSSNRDVRDRPQQRHYSSDTIISNVPVYKAHIGEKPKSDRTFQRSQSIERHLGTKVERRFSADMSVKESLGEFQQRGRPREMRRENPLRRSHSIDAYSTDVLHPSALSRQSSHTSQISRQSSREHAIITQSFPMTQRKLLQDPDSGQYFFVDMPVQVKTFFDPESGGYVQLPVQPAESAAPQASPLEVLTPPLVVYHSFVPVPLSAIAQNAAVHGTHTVPEVFEQRHTEGSQQTHCKETQPYLEPVYAQHDYMIGEFLGTEELDCPS